MKVRKVSAVDQKDQKIDIKPVAPPGGATNQPTASRILGPNSQQVTFLPVGPVFGAAAANGVARRD